MARVWRNLRGGQPMLPWHWLHLPASTTAQDTTRCRKFIIWKPHYLHVVANGSLQSMMLYCLLLSPTKAAKCRSETGPSTSLRLQFQVKHLIRIRGRIPAGSMWMAKTPPMYIDFGPHCSCVCPASSVRIRAATRCAGPRGTRNQ